ncbi:TIGR02270 family protein [Variovorax humicola]|uniref:TIGR02270 family protein n=1 Tax=Variovorax humicola TaxID=1769758 RepID=A0ABU8W3Z8_9BURK
MVNAALHPIPAVIEQHAGESAHLCHVRSTLVDAPHVRLGELRRIDSRLAAHLDGLAVAGAFGRKVCEAAVLAKTAHGEVFAAIARAIEDGDTGRLDQLLTLAEANLQVQAGALFAFNWVSAQWLKGITRGLLDSSSAFRRRVGIAACASHLVDAGPALTSALHDADAPLRATALRVAGEGGRSDLLPLCLGALTDDDAECRFQAIQSAALLGDRRAAVAALRDFALERGPYRARSLMILLKLATPAQAAAILKGLSDSEPDSRVLIRSAGIAGDPQWVSWLIGRMDDARLARLAGESFSTITGLDLSSPGFAGEPPQPLDPVPADDPEIEDIAVDEDDGLPWPSPPKLQAWWSANAHRFQAGARSFLGAPPSRAHCLKVLGSGYQRQRIAAAQFLCILQPGTKLFPTSAPAWRQQRWLDTMGA